MPLSVLSVNIQYERDTVNARQRARQVSRLLGFDAQDQTRISTAVSEIARNVFNYAGGGKVEYIVEGITRPQLLIVKVTDHGPGIRNLSEILEGRYQSTTGMGLGIIGAKRLMDQFQIDSSPEAGTTVQLKKLLPKRAPLVTESELARIVSELVNERPQDPVQELLHQNQELLKALSEIRTRQQELTQLNRELEDTNRGVVALYAELDEKADHLRRADELKSKFLSNMSHEFRSPLNSILALSGLLRDKTDGDLTGEQEQQVGYIRKAAQDLLDLVNDLLDLAKVEAGKVEAKPIDFEVANLFAALRGMLRPLLLNQSVELTFDDASAVPSLFSDEGKISQILRNFISNALKFTEKGEVRVSAEVAGDDEVAFSVSDSGIGIAPQDIDAIFQDFVQLDHPLQRKVKGTGLGLPLSKKLAIFLGGRVEVHSKVGAGSTFTLRVPRVYRDASQNVGVPEEPPAWAPDPGAQLVLLLEDSPEIVMAYKSYLRDSGFQLVTASTTRQAEDVLDRMLPRIIVLDIVLRSEDTWALMASLKERTETKNIPILIASTVEDRAKGFHLGADAYLVKPIEREDLLRELRALTGAQALKRALIIDDNEMDRYLLKQHLKNLPLSILEEAGGMPGIRRARETRPDLIFLDLTMPDMTGFEVLDELKGRPETASIPVAIVTSRKLTEFENRNLADKCVAIIGKDRLGDAIIRETVNRTLKDAGVLAK
ncbi:MAG TPA: ATP-binding protein [Bryobacteraceae bacterium]|jgi:signal transduction histidine kinase/DNA-binding response OmpR family regulator|nr:ATP-binding protein [Bryobacteraceae bacterium]